MTQALKFDLETVARIIDPEVFDLIEHYDGLTCIGSDEQRRGATFQAYPSLEARYEDARAKAAAIMALHDADPARQMADDEAALWREHDARHSAAELEVLKGAMAALKGQAEQWAMEARAHKSSLHEAYQAVTGATGEPGNWSGAEPIVAELSRLRADLAEAVGVLEPFARGYEESVRAYPLVGGETSQKTRYAKSDRAESMRSSVGTYHFQQAAALLSRLKDAKP